MTSFPSGGVALTAKGCDFAVWSHHAERVELCLFDSAGDVEICRLPMTLEQNGHHRLHVEGVRPGTRYGYRAHGRYVPDQGLWFDPSKLLVDPYAKEIDRPFRQDPRLGIFGENTDSLVPKAIVTEDVAVARKPPLFAPGGLIYEVPVRAFTMLHPDVPEHQRGTIAALAHPAILSHLKKLKVDAVELMPIVAWLDERHLGPLGLVNGWGYNPVALMAIDPRLAPGGVRELRDTVAALHAEGIGVILDVVFNHTGEGDRHGGTLSLRGLDNLSCYRHLPDNPGVLVNDTGCGNTLACDHVYVRRLILDSLRHFVLHAGVDGFRFDLAPILGRTARGFHTTARTLHAIACDSVLADRVLIAEPWDVGPGGYQLGNFPQPYLEWNDRARDTVRRFWRGDDHMRGAFATALAGSQDVLARHGETLSRTVNFIAAHDGFTLLDLVSHTHKRNGRNGENNHDGHDENFSWNNGTEGMTDDPEIVQRRRHDVAALISTLFSMRGTIMLTAGDEGGRTQHGNNNAYCQDNEITWIDWQKMDRGLVNHTAVASALRKRFDVFSGIRFFTGENGDVEWMNAAGEPNTIPDWEEAEGATLTMILKTRDRETGRDVRVAILFNRAQRPRHFVLPQTSGLVWHNPFSGEKPTSIMLQSRTVALFIEY